ncbi:MAG TPA: ATP-binding protein [Acidimicrobiia bacterium]|nr:ATP-binding protein [Acidimicrobiia bacterium]
MAVVALDVEPMDVDELDLEQMDRGGMAVAELGVTPARRRRPSRLESRVGALIGGQLVVAAGFGLLAHSRGYVFGEPWIVATLALTFALTGFFAMSLEFHRHRFTFTLAEAVLAVGFFAVGPIGLAVAAALGECVNLVAQRHSPLKIAFNVSNRLVATTAAAIAFAAIGNNDVHDAAAWVAALGAAICFSILDVASTAAVLSIVEETRFHNVFVRSATAGLLATLTAAPIGLVALDLAQRGPFVPLLLAPIAIAVALNAGYAVSQRDEHLRFERLYESSARTAGLVAFDDALRSLAAETRSLGTGVAAMCCATGADGEWRGAYSDDGGEHLAAPGAIADAVNLATRVGDHEVDAAHAAEVARLAPAARSAVVASAEHENGRVLLVVLRDGTANSGAKSRVETLAAFAHNAALIASNALLHEEREVALARQVDLNRQKSDFVAAVSHELRTPLAVMLGSVHTLDRLDGRMTEEQRTQLFEMTVEQGARLQRLIDELLLVAAAEHSDVQLQLEPIKIAELFASVAVASAAAVGSDRLVCADGDAGSVVSDASKLERILLNLVENAAKYAPEAPVELRAQAVGAELCLSVVDHGPGIPACDRERVFERFVQLDQSSTRRQGGTGLGLHLCRQLADLVEGRMTLAETPGGGCTFSITIPRALDSVESAPETEPTTNFSFGNVRSRPETFDALPIPEPAR